MADSISEGLRALVTTRAQGRCEYCQTPEAFATERFSIEHILPRVLGGLTEEQNLALACQGCNGHKATKTTAFDPMTKELASLFHPRQHIWTEHFKWSEDAWQIIGQTAEGKATVALLQVNRSPLQTAIEMQNVAEPFILRRAIRHLEQKRVVIFVAGTGHPYFSTDTTAALRASEIGANVILKATKVDGIYDRDPKLHPNAKRYEQITYSEALTQRLQVMDSTAFSLCMDNKIPIIVFDMNKPTNIRDAVLGKKIGTLVSE